MGSGFPNIADIGGLAALSAYGTGDGDQNAYACQYVRTGVGVYEVTIDRPVAATDGIVVVTPRGDLSAHASVEHVSDTLKRIRTWNNLGAFDVDFDLIVFDVFGSGQQPISGILVAVNVTGTGDVGPGSASVNARGTTIAGTGGGYTGANFTNDKNLGAVGSPINTGSAQMSINPNGDPSDLDTTEQLILTGDVDGATVASSFAYLAFDLAMAFGSFAFATAAKTEGDSDRGGYVGYGGVLTKVGTGHFRFVMTDGLDEVSSLILATCGRLYLLDGPIQGQISVNFVDANTRDIYTFAADGTAQDCPFSMLVLERS